MALTWKTGLVGLLIALACCGLWKLLMWLLESRRAMVNWTKVRFWWPTAMLVWGWALALFSRSESWGSAFDAVLLVFGLLNFPVLVVVGMLAWFSNQIIHPPVWVQALVGSVIMWSGNHLLVRIAEWRAWISVPVSLHLEDGDSRSPKNFRSLPSWRRAGGFA